MAFTGRLGTDDSQLGNIVLGSDGSGGTTTVDGSITADAVLLASASVTFTADAVINSLSFTANAVIKSTQSGSFAADAVLLHTVQTEYAQYVGHGTLATGTSSTITYPLPLGIQDRDILFLIIESNNQAPSTPSGWSIVPGSPVTETVNNPTRISLFYKVYSSGGTAPQTVNASGDHFIGRVFAIRGSLLSTPWGAIGTASDTGNVTTLVLAGITTTSDQALVLITLAGGADNVTGSRLSNWTNASLTELTERIDDFTALGGGGGIGVATGKKTTAGVVSTTTVTSSGTSAAQDSVSITLEMLPRRIDFTADAVITASSAVSSNFTADAVLLKTTSATFTANARLLRVISTTFTANAVIAFATFTANAVILKTVTTSRTANAVIKKPNNLRTFTADAYFGSTPVPPVLIFEDTFTRTTSAGNIGTPSGGHQEVVTYSWPDSSPEYYVDGSKLVVPVSDGFPEVQFNLGEAAEEFDVYFDIVTVVNGYYQFWGPQRYNPAGTPPFNYTRQYITIDNDAGDGTSWEIFVPSFDGVNSPFETLTLTANTTYRVHAQVIGSTVKARIFDPALAEPSTWDVQGIGAIASTDSVDQNTAGIYIGWVDTIVAPLSLDNLQIYARGIQRQDFFTADAYIGVGGPTEHTGTFTADAYLSQPFIRYGYSFSANAVIKGITSKTITANARIILSGSGTFTANAYIRGVAEKVFTASAVIRRPAAAPGESRFSKITTLQVQRRRDRALSTFVPPRNPDEGEDEETEKELPCLPPCPPGSGGLGGLYGPNGLAIRKTIFYCASCGGNFFHTPENDLGVGPGASTTHGCCTSSHSDVNHVSRMWVQYATVPAGVFQMRAKALWVGDLPNTTVQVYANAVMPDLELEDCMGYDPDWWLSHWQAGDHIGNLVFTKTGGTSLFGVDFNWGTEASALTIDGRTLTNYVFKFRMLDEMNYCGLQFKPSNMEVTVGE